MILVGGLVLRHFTDGRTAREQTIRKVKMRVILLNCVVLGMGWYKDWERDEN